jgi:hypothetical protein
MEEPSWSSGTKYLYVFSASLIVNIIIHFLAYQRYVGNMPFIPHAIGSIMFYYKDLRTLPPYELDIPSIKALVYGSLIAGSIGLIILFISDLLEKSQTIQNNY